MHLRSLKSGLLYVTCQHVLLPLAAVVLSNVRQVPLGQAASMRVVNALSRNGEDALVGEEELLHRAVGCGMAAV